MADTAAPPSTPGNRVPGREGAARAPLARPAPPPPPPPPTPRQRRHEVAPKSSRGPANITVVTTVDDLIEAMADRAQDIEIRSHLDLRGLSLSPILHWDPTRLDRPVEQPGVLLNVPESVRSIRGNCSQPDPFKGSGTRELGHRGVSDLLPLKPRQCLIVFHTQLLALRSPAVWLDNLYFKWHPRTRTNHQSAEAEGHVQTNQPLHMPHTRGSDADGVELVPLLDVVSVLLPAGFGPPDGNSPQAQDRVHVFVTNASFQSSSLDDGHGNLVGIDGNYQPSSFLLEDCIFSDWNGPRAPIASIHTAANIRHTVFRNLRLRSEIVDISFGGIVRLEDVRLANVTLTHGNIVSTTSNDYCHYPHSVVNMGAWYEDSPITFLDYMYYADDDASYDVEVAEVPSEQRTLFGEEWRVAEATMLNCFPVPAYIKNLSPDTPLSAAWRQRVTRVTGVPACTQGLPNLVVADYMPSDPSLVAGTVGKVVAQTVDLLLKADDSWFLMTKQVLPDRVQDGEWPPLTLDPPPNPQPRASLQQEPVPFDAQIPVLNLSTSGLAPHASHDALGAPLSPEVHDGEGRLNRTIAYLTVMAVCVLVVAAAGLLYIVLKRRSQRRGHRGGIGGLASICGVQLSAQASDAGCYTKFTCQISEAERRHRRQVRHLNRQLCMFGEADMFHGKYEMLLHQRVHGERSVVQLMEDTAERFEYAAKFFLDRDAFLTEAALHAACSPYGHRKPSADILTRAESLFATPADPLASCRGPDDDIGWHRESLQRVLPRATLICTESAEGLEDPTGQPLPPCIVMEVGQSLQDWLGCRQADNFSALAVLASVSRCVAELHDAGLVHRNLKPTTILWLPRESKWALTGFATVARIGQACAAPLRITLAYAAPEAAAAVHLQERELLSEPALDAWALGVLAVEIFTGAPPFDMITTGHSKVVAALQGHRPLPWEGDNEEALHRALGILSGPVQQLLQRNPAQRPPVRRFHETCTQAFVAARSGRIAR